MRMKQRLHKFLLRHGYVYESTRYWTGRHDKWLKSLEFVTPLMKATFDEYYYGIKEGEEKLRMMEKRVEEIAVSGAYVEGVKKLRCFKGGRILRRFRSPIQHNQHQGISLETIPFVLWRGQRVH